jgi:hypothetical protein
MVNTPNFWPTYNEKLFCGLLLCIFCHVIVLMLLETMCKKVGFWASNF